MAEVSFGEWLKSRRKAAGLTQEQLAQQISCSTSALRKLEAEERRPSGQVVQQLARIFNIPSDEQATFLKFARGDWEAAPAGGMENAPWRGTQPSEDEYLARPRIHLATFFFTDIEGSTKLWESAPEKMRVALQHHHAILQEATSSNSGEVFQTIGDAFCAVFATASNALSAAVSAQRALYQASWDLPFSIRVRIGIHTGEAEPLKHGSSTGGYASNPTMNRVARILNAAHGGQVLLSSVTKELLKDTLPANTELRDLGKHYLKDLARPEHLFQLDIAGFPSIFPPLKTLNARHNLPVQLTSFVGREKRNRGSARPAWKVTPDHSHRSRWNWQDQTRHSSGERVIGSISGWNMDRGACLPHRTRHPFDVARRADGRRGAEGDGSVRTAHHADPA